MRSILRVLVVALVLGSGCAEPTPEPPAADATPEPQAAAATPNRGPLACALRGEPTCELGSAPQLTVTLVNQTGEDIYLVGCLDGSYGKCRYPHCYFEVTGPDGQPIELEYRRRCANMNTLRWADFTEVSPGGTFDPCQRGFFCAGPSAGFFRVPGKYRVRFVYSTKGDDIRGWAGDDPWGEVPDDDTMIALFGRVPRVEVRSNEFEVTALAPGK